MAKAIAHSTPSRRDLLRATAATAALAAPGAALAAGNIAVDPILATLQRWRSAHAAAERATELRSAAEEAWRDAFGNDGIARVTYGRLRHNDETHTPLYAHSEGEIIKETECGILNGWRGAEARRESLLAEFRADVARIRTAYEASPCPALVDEEDRLWDAVDQLERTIMAIPTPSPAFVAAMLEIALSHAPEHEVGDGDFPWPQFQTALAGARQLAGIGGAA
jgi:hypothetical protein